jgi:hypothetical protein
MSSAKDVNGVLKASLKRISLRWAKGAWKKERPVEIKNDGLGKNSYCLEGSCTGGDRRPKNRVQAQAIEYLRQAVVEYTNGRYNSVPSFNDAEETKHEDVVNVVLIAQQKAKAGALQSPVDRPLRRW